MTIPARTVRALRDARRRLRDVAAAEHGVASTASMRAAASAASADALVDATVADAVAALAAARSVAELDQVARVVDQDRDAARLAHKDAERAAADALVAQQQLAARERQLRSMEKLIERMDADRARGEAKADQRLADDRASRRGDS